MEARLKINFNTKELEAEGTEQFIHAAIDKVRALFSGENVTTTLNEEQTQIIENQPLKAKRGRPATTNPETVSTNNEVPLPAADFLSSDKSEKLSGTARILLAGYIAQEKSKKNYFLSKDANKILDKRGILPATPAQSVFLSVKANLLTKVERGKYQISEKGLNQLQKIVLK